MNVAIAPGDQVNVGRPRPPKEDPEALRRVLMGVKSAPMEQAAPQGYPNPDARANPLSPGQADETAHDADIAPRVDHGDNLGVVPMPPPPTTGAAPGTSQYAPQKLSDPMQDPSFRAFVAQRAADLAELRTAQRQAAETRGSAGFRIGSGLMAFGGSSGDELKARYEQAGQPVADVLARQKASGELTKNAAEDVGLSGTMLKNREAGEANDPNSPYSQAMAVVLKARPDLAGKFRGSMAPALESQNKVDAERLHAEGTLAQERMKLEEETRHHKVEESYMGQKDLPPNITTELESKLNAVKALDDLRAQKENSGTFDKLLSKLPGDVGDFAQTKAVTAAEVAKADAKGRVNPSGAIREKSNLPGAFQNDTGLNAKREQLLRDADQQLKVLAAGRVRPEQIAEYKRQIEELRTGGQAVGPSHYLISPDRKRRIPADASGKPLGPAEPNPDA